MSTTMLDDALEQLRRARTPHDLFGTDPDEAGRRYRRMALLLHPDSSGGRTAHAFTTLLNFWRSYNARATATFRVGGHAYDLGPRSARGDLADLYTVTRDGVIGKALLKIVRDPAHNDLMEREAMALRQLFKEGEGRFLAYVPRLLESFKHRDQVTGDERRVNVIERAADFISLAAVREVHPDGVDARDVAWIWRRLLVALGFAHKAGVLHGAVLPEHVLIHPELHGLMLVDWCYSVPGCYTATDPSGRVPAMVSRYAAWYPAEVPLRRRASPATDIAMATRCMVELMGDRAPEQLQWFAKGCLLTPQNRRPSDAWRLLEELDELLERLFGPREFRPFEPPSTPPSAS